jgi:hypothetical protein
MKLSTFLSSLRLAACALAAGASDSAASTDENGIRSIPVSEDVFSKRTVLKIRSYARIL